MGRLGLAVTTFDFTLEQPVLDLYAPPTLDTIDTSGEILRSLVHRREFAEHPRSADCATARRVARRWHKGGDLRGAWAILEHAPQGQDLAKKYNLFRWRGRFQPGCVVEPGGPADALVAALDQAGQWLEIPLIMGAVGSDNRRYAAQGFPTVGSHWAGSAAMQPDGVPKYVDPDALDMAGRLLLATIGQLAW